MTPAENVSVHSFRRNDIVRLLNRHGDHPSGTAGRIIGRFARTEPTYVVSFTGQLPCVEVRSDQIVLTEDLRASA